MPEQGMEQVSDVTSVHSKKRWLHLSILSPHDLQRVLDQPVCCMLYILQLGLTHSSYVVHVCFLLWPEVQSHPDDSHVQATGPRFACSLTQARPTMLCIHLVANTVCRYISLRSEYSELKLNSYSLHPTQYRLLLTSVC